MPDDTRLSNQPPRRSAQHVLSELGAFIDELLEDLRGAPSRREPLSKEVAPLLNTSEAATVLGTSTKKIRELVKRREIPFVRVGSQYRFALEELESWIEQQRGLVVKPTFASSRRNGARNRRPQVSESW